MNTIYPNTAQLAVRWEPSIDLESCVHPKLSTWRLLSPNSEDARSIVSLFRQHYGLSYPDPEVYHTRYWVEQDLTNFAQNNLSIGLFQNKLLIAHLALRVCKFGCLCDATNLAVHPAYQAQILEVGHSLWNAITALGTQLRWKFLRMLHRYSEPLSDVLSHNCFAGVEIAYLPEPSFLRFGMLGRATQSQAHRIPILVTYSTLDKKNRDTHSLYPPTRHLKIIAKIYASLGVKRNLITGDRVGNVRGKNKPSTIFAKSKSENSNSAAISIEPGLLLSFRSGIKYIEHVRTSAAHLGKVSHVEISMKDPACPAFADSLELNGYSFSGIMPMVNGNDKAVYLHSDDFSPHQLTKRDSRHSGLRDYLIDQNQHC